MFLLTLVTGCASEPPTVGKAIAFEQVCDQSNDGQRVSVEGFLTLPEEIPTNDTVSVLLEIRPSENVEPRGERVGVWTTYGSDANQVASVKGVYTAPTLDELKNNSQNPPSPNQSSVQGTYTHADLKVTTSDGQQITYTDRVRVSGKVVFPSSPGVTAISPCVLNNPLIERIE
ncbi:MAG TPA: hypothetical protein V6C78_19930 [Crinalium sp.]